MRRFVRAAFAFAVGVAGVGLWAGPALAVECPSRATQCKDWPKAAGQGWMQDVVCPSKRSGQVQQVVRNLTSVKLTLAVGDIDCYDWSNTGNPSKITGRVLGPGERLTYRLEKSWNADYGYRLGFFVPSDTGLRKLGSGRVGLGSRDTVVRVTNMGERISDAVTCRRKLLGEDTKRTASTESFFPPVQNNDFPPNSTTVYSDGMNLIAVYCRNNGMVMDYQ